MDLPSYISGYVDGEGCFNVSFCRRAAMRTGWDVRPSFSVSQNDDRQEVLELMLGYYRVWNVEARPKRQHHQIRGARHRQPSWQGGPAFRGVSTDICEAK